MTPGQPQRVEVSYTFFKQQVEADNVAQISTRADTIQGAFKQAVPYQPDSAVPAKTAGDFSTVIPAFADPGLEIDILNRTVHAGTSELHLTSLEQSLLYLLAANAGRVLTREEILDTLWGVDVVAESNVVDRQIRNLRGRFCDIGLG